MDPMAKMWVSFVGIGLMVFAALVVSFARTRPKGLLRTILTILATFMLVVGIIYGFFAIL